jgi:hypothetical protein
MDLRERERDRERELWVAQQIASELNRLRGSDYIANPPRQAEDAVLVSMSGTYPPLAVEVVSAPISPVVRRDHKNYFKLDKILKDELEALGLRDGHFSVAWAEETVLSKIKPEPIRRLARLIRDLSAEHFGQLTIEAEDIHDRFPELASLFNYVICSRSAALTETSVSSPTFCWLPDDRRWIAEAVDKKAHRVAEILVVDGGCYITREQVSAFSRDFDMNTCKFKQLWVVSTNEIFQIK